MKIKCDKSLILLAIVNLEIFSAMAFPITNKMRYSNPQDQLPSESIPMEQMAAFDQDSVINKYRINNRMMMSSRNYADDRYINDEHDDDTRGGLDSEDRFLLNKFYQETRAQDPFLGHSLSTESLWNENRDQEAKKLSALLDTTSSIGTTEATRFYPLSKSSNIIDDAMAHMSTISDQYDSHFWTIDPDLIKQSKMLSSKLVKIPHLTRLIQQQANYSPDLKLLTSYDPLSATKSTLVDSSHGNETKNLDRIVGATLFGQGDDRTTPNVSSKLPIDALRLHDELMIEPPLDGKVRVRMYFHKAIHDDPRLYGTGPWKYWGHGWGVEYGYDPSDQNKKDFYQKGYTIERAYGRDFCKDQTNCRPPDPDFFKDPRNVGNYSEQQHHSASNRLDLSIKTRRRPIIRSLPNF